MHRTAAYIAAPFRATRGGHRPSLFSLAVLTLGLLLWARFLLVTGHPRTAIAEPSERAHASAVQQAEPNK